MSHKHLFACTLAVGALLTPLVAVVHAQPQSAPQATTHADKKNTAAPKKPGRVQSEGERIFAQNCSRCHTAPDGFSPSISGTVVRHMRVRASLSQHDEQELLRFLNP
ncbi:c-type cytochrome [Acidicapsa ligni]|uniref:c-type cytochrome n=1 Tax=Acidicapsa ligni TaxID=542300 RepID=UPI0021DF7FF2|nr:cytochrome c [Acidicapsa ligni]